MPNIRTVMIGENILLSSIAAVIGLILSQYLILFIRISAGDIFPRLAQLKIDSSLVSMIIVVFIVIASILALVVNKTLAKADLIDALRGSGKGAISTKIGNIKQFILSFQIIVAAIAS